MSVDIYSFIDNMPEEWQRSNQRYWEWSLQGADHPHLCSKGDILYVSTFFLGICSGTKGIIVACDPYELGLSANHRYPTANGMQWKAMIEQNPLKAVHGIARRIERMEAKVVVLKNDQLPLERSIILACRQLGIPSIVVQHGIINPKAERFLNVGDWADHRVVWGSYFARMVEAYGLDAKVWTYPRVVPEAPAVEKSVCILGPTPRAEVWFVRRVCRSLNIPVRYRFHPSAEEPRKQKCRVRGTIAATPIWDDIRDHSIFIGTMSTGLVEAGLAGRVAIQLRSKEVPNLENAGACYSIEPDYFTLRDYIQTATPLPVSSDYIRATDDLIGDWKKILEEVCES